MRPLRRSGSVVKVSAGEGIIPFWVSDGRRLACAAGGRRIAATMAVSGSLLDVIRRDTLASYEGSRNDVDPHTGRMLVSRPPSGRQIVVVLNWIAEVRAKLRRR